MTPPPSEPVTTPVAEGNAAATAPAATPEATAGSAQAPLPPESATPSKALADNTAPAAAQRSAATPTSDIAATPAAPPGPISIVRNPPRIDVLDESVRQGFAAYDRGDYSTARMQYQKASKADPRNRQAILGLAATEEATGNSSAAASLYVQALTLDPRDSVAQAALLNLTTADPAQGESKLRLLLTEQPDRPFLHFALGNVLAAQQRWPEAEQAYFRASGLDTGNPDFAFNLAISLDQLHQRQPAREYYQRALDLASKRPARFDRQSARQRLEQLSAQP
jgi:tetratricopeptide (TPR) repeat protein